MRTRTTGVGLAMLLTTIGLLAAAPAASADSATCTFSGWVMPSRDIAPIPSTGGAGNYNLGAVADCEYVEATGLEGNSEYPTRASISSSGVYQNDFCSTGWFFSDWGLSPDTSGGVGATTINFDDLRATDVTVMAHAIRFTSGVGKLVVGTVNNRPNSGGSGVVQLLPAAGQSCTGPPGVQMYDVLGAFTLNY